MPNANLARSCREIAALPDESRHFSQMVRRIMEIIRKNVACDSINLGTIDLRTENGFHYDLDGFLMPKDRRDLLPRFKSQNPMVEFTRRNGTAPPLRFTDFSTRRQFEERPIYRECYRGYTHSMITFGLEAPKDLSTSFVLSRSSGDFTDSEQDTLAIIQPLVSSVVQRQMLKESLVGSQFSGAQVGVIHGYGDFIHTLDARAKHLLNKFFEDASLHRLPETLADRMQNRSDDTFEISCECTRSKLLSSARFHSDSWTLHLWEKGEDLPTEALSRFGFTGRQIEVIQWMALGKTNPEIATILDISYRTVQKHLEHIYARLGVETRIAAINRCREIAL